MIRQTVKYYYHKIDKGNSGVKKWLSKDNSLNHPCAVVFYDGSEKSKKQYEEFIAAGKPENRKNTIIIVIDKGKIWFLQPISEVGGLPKEENGNIPKAIEVNILKIKDLKDVPAILSNMATNTYLYTGAFREIKWLGNIKAMEWVLGQGELSERHYEKDKLTNSNLLECLSSVELETLVAKLLEEDGCFVPAYRGGCMKDVDLFAINDNSLHDIALGGMEIPKGRSISIQVKIRDDGRSHKDVDYFIALDAKLSDHSFNADWLMSQIQERKHINTRKWLIRSLKWLPDKFLGHYGLRKDQAK